MARSGSAVLLDSSVWIEILGKGVLADVCEAELKKAAKVVVPTVVLYEVYKKVARSISEDQALAAAALLSSHQLEDLDRTVSLRAADLSIEHGLGMADSLVLAHSERSGAVLVTLDNDFARIPAVRIVRATP